MNKSELIDAVASACKESKSTVNNVLDALFNNVVPKTLKKGDKITIVGFGTWEKYRRAATTGRNPQTGAPIKIAASNQAKFKPGKALKDAIN